MTTHGNHKKTGLSWFFSFPDPVNEVSARLVAGMVVALALSAIFTQQVWIVAFMVYGFLAHVASGPKFSPIGLLATKVITPRLGWDKPTSGIPKRFAQGIGLVFSTTALVLFLVNLPVAAIAVLSVLTLFAALESFVGFCAGCFVFNQLMRIGVIPESVCEECANYIFNRSQTANA
ncbi:MAG: DUF4395 domain-containing protein [Chloroflexi bacterium]|nr:DUF4395 domain-containing protein [Chloroflexota bacterium]